MKQWTDLTEALSQLPYIENLTEVKQQLDSLKPFSQEVEGRVMQKIKLDWNFHSNAIEGNKLTYGETYTFLMYGLTAKGKPLKDHLDIKGHNEAINFLISIVKDDADLREGDIRDLHKMILIEPYKSQIETHDGQKRDKTILIGEYKKMPNSVRTPTGEMHYYADPIDVPKLMSDLVEWYNTARKNENIHPSVLATFFHHRFVAIHPFDDGNGRLGRILMNLILMQKGYPPAVVKLKERTDYYAALNQADKNEYAPIMEFVAEEVLNSMNLYLKAARGESIEEDDDIDKEIHLFKSQFGDDIIRQSEETDTYVYKDVLVKIHAFSQPKMTKFNDLFEQNSVLVSEAGSENLSIYYHWTTFKKAKIPFNHTTNLQIARKPTEFIIYIDNKEHKVYKYGIQLSEQEKKNIAAIWVKKTLDDIQKKITAK